MFFDLYYDDKIVGKVELSVVGMYYIISCRSRINAKGKVRLQVLYEGKKIPLGLCVPYQDGLGTVCRIPCCKIDCKDAMFTLVNENDSQYKAVRNHHPFQHIKKLPDARFAITNQGAAILIATMDD